MPYNHYYINSSNQLFNELSPILLYTGCVNNESNWFNIPHKHDFCEILYVKKGKSKVIISGKTYEVSEGDLIVLNSNVLHEEISFPNSLLHLIFLGIDNLKLNNLPKNCLISKDQTPIIKTKSYRYKTENYLLDLLNESIQQADFYLDICNGLVVSLIALIIRIYSGKDYINNLSDDECIKIKQYIDTKYQSSITLDDLSESVYISKHHLAHLFKKKEGISPIKYLIQKRIEEACKLIVQTDMSFAEISKKVGYENNVYFSQVFKKTTGFSPSHYRSMYK